VAKASKMWTKTG